MSTSRRGGVILYDFGDFDDDEPVDTVLVYDEIIGSALHKADEAAQVRACWGALNATLSNDPVYLEVRERTTGGVLATAAADRTAWYPFPFRARFSPKIKADGSGYRARIRIAGCSSAGDRVDFALVLSPTSSSARYVTGELGHVVAVATNVTSTTPAWLTWDSGLTYVDIGAETIAAAQDAAEVPTYTELGGDRVSVQASGLELIVCGQTWATASKPRLYAVYDAEVIGS